MEYTDSLRETNDQFWNLLTEGAILSKVMLGILCCVAVGFLLFALFRKLRRKWDSIYYVLICASVLIWASCSLLALLKPDSIKMFNMLRLVGIIPIPSLLCLHVKKQISYKKQHLVPAVLFFTDRKSVV